MCFLSPFFCLAGLVKQAFALQLRAGFQALITKTTTKRTENKTKVSPPSPRRTPQEFRSWAQNDRPANWKLPLQKEKKKELSIERAQGTQLETKRATTTLDQITAVALRQRGYWKRWALTILRVRRGTSSPQQPCSKCPWSALSGLPSAEASG